MGRKAGDVKVAILVATGFEQAELAEPRETLRMAGLPSDIVAPDKGKVQGWDRTDWGKEFDVDVALEAADPDDYDVLFLPGSVMNPERLRKDRRAEEFVSSFFEAGKPVAALCRGPWDLIDCGVQRGRRRNSYRTIRTDFERFVDRIREELVVRPEAEDAELAEMDDGVQDPAPRGSSRDAGAARARQMLLWVNTRRQPATGRGNG